MIDGNTTALNAYQREQDAIADGEAYLEHLHQELADDMFDAYVTGNSDVIDEVNDGLLDTQTVDNIIDQMRYAMAKECQRPLMGRGGEVYDAYMNIISDECERIAKRCSTPDDFDKFRCEYGI